MCGSYNCESGEPHNRHITFNRVGIGVLAKKITENGNILQIKIPIHFFIKDITKPYSNFNFRLVGSKCILVYTCYYSLAYFQVFFLFIGRRVLIVKVIYVTSVLHKLLTSKWPRNSEL